MNTLHDSLRDKSILITGGTTGIGRATAKLLLQSGAKVLIFARDENALQHALSELQPLGQIHGLTADNSREEDLNQVFAAADTHLGPLDILINNAAVSAKQV